MRKIHDTARLRGADCLFSNVSLTARPFFEKWGFGVESPQIVQVRGIALRNFRMCKQL